MVDSEDKKHIDNVISGDGQAFRYLIDKYKDQVFAMCLRMLKNREEAEELAQDVFVNVYQSLGKFKGDSKFSTWLYRIVFNAAVSQLRKKKTHFKSLDDPDTGHEEACETYNSFDQLNNKDKEMYLNEAINKLNEMDAMIISLYYYHDNSIEEISEVCGLSVSNVKVKLMRIRKRLFVELNEILKHEVKSLL